MWLCIVLDGALYDERGQGGVNSIFLLSILNLVKHRYDMSAVKVEVVTLAPPVPLDQGLHVHGLLGPVPVRGPPF